MANQSGMKRTILLVDDDELILRIENSSAHCGGAMYRETVTVTATFTDPDGGDTHSATIDWGDATVVVGTGRSNAQRKESGKLRRVARYRLRRPAPSTGPLLSGRPRPVMNSVK